MTPRMTHGSYRARSAWQKAQPVTLVLLGSLGVACGGGGEGPKHGSTPGSAGSQMSGGGASSGSGGAGGSSTNAGGSTSGGGSTPSEKLVVVPASVTLAPNGMQTFSCTNAGKADTCTWSISEGDSGGTISAEGAYVAPKSMGTYHVVAKSTTDASLTATGTVIVPPTGDGKPGVWTKVAMPIAFKYAMSLVADPAVPNVLYGFVTDGSDTPFHVVKSDDYGATWSVVSKTEMKGDPWGATIDPNRARDPATSPVLYTPAGYGTRGMFKSTDGGVNWTQMFSSMSGNALAAVSNGLWPPDVYSVVALPDSVDHILVSYHFNGDKGWNGVGDTGIGESKDGGKTWEAHIPPPGMGESQYLTVVDVNTWLTISQGTDGKAGMWRTTTGGRVGGKPDPSAWKNVDKLEHLHGCYTSLVTADAVYAPGYEGIRVSKNKGETWDWAYDAGQGGYMSSVVATKSFLYGDFLLGPKLVRSPISDGKTWASYGDTPAGMAGMLGPGAQTVVSVTDGTKWYIINFNNDGGVWRYIEQQ